MTVNPDELAPIRGPKTTIETWLVRSIIAGHEIAQEHLRLELHDGVAQTLAQAFLCLQTVEATPDARLPEMRPSIAQAATLIRSATREIRELIYSLRPASLDTVGLIRTLESELEELGRTGLATKFHADAVALPQTVETALYRIAHEALNNVAQHAMARSVRVKIVGGRDRVTMVVQDDGVGFDPVNVFEAEERVYHGIGLLSMRTRAELLNGKLAVTSAPACGTTIEVDLPVVSQ